MASLQSWQGANGFMIHELMAETEPWHATRTPSAPNAREQSLIDWFFIDKASTFEKIIRFRVKKNSEFRDDSKNWGARKTDIKQSRTHTHTPSNIPFLKFLLQIEDACTRSQIEKKFAGAPSATQPLQTRSRPLSYYIALLQISLQQNGERYWEEDYLPRNWWLADRMLRDGSYSYRELVLLKTLGGR